MYSGFKWSDYTESNINVSGGITNSMTPPLFTHKIVACPTLFV